MASHSPYFDPQKSEEKVLQILRTNFATTSNFSSQSDPQHNPIKGKVRKRKKKETCYNSGGPRLWIANAPALFCKLALLNTRRLFFSWSPTPGILLPVRRIFYSNCCYRSETERLILTAHQRVWATNQQVTHGSNEPLKTYPSPEGILWYLEGYSLFRDQRSSWKHSQ